MLPHMCKLLAGWLHAVVAWRSRMFPLHNCPHPLSALQVLNKEFEVLTHLARTAGAFGRRDAAVALGGLVDKIHELKHKCGSCTGVCGRVWAACAGQQGP